MIKIFMSQSGKKSNDFALIFQQWIKDTFTNEINIFIATEDIRIGSDWLYILNQELKDTDIGIFFLTKESIKSDWMIYEAGAISTNIKKQKINNRKTKRQSIICSILIDIEQEKIPNPLQKFQNFYLNDQDSLIKLLHLIHSISKSKKNIKSIEENFKNYWLKELKKHTNNIQFNDKNKINLEKYDMNVQNPDCEYGIISTIPKKSFHNLRADIIEIENNELILIGSSLSEAFDPGNETTDISKLLKEKINNLPEKHLYALKIVLSEPEIFSINYQYSQLNSFDETPTNRINRTLKTLLNMAKEYNRLHISIYFIPLLQIDHIVMTKKYMIIRHTMLWTYSGEFKGTRFLCDSSKKETSLYGSYRKYIEQLMKLSVCIESDNYLNIYRGNSFKTDSEQFHNNWRQEFLNLTNKNIRIYKLYREQLISDLHSSWDFKYRNYFSDINVTKEKDVFNFNHGEIFKNKEDLYNSKNLIGDKTQEDLLIYIKETESMLDSLMKRYDANGGFAHIYPSFDLGIPNNIQRLAGGFATGIYVTWRCGTPIVPIDTTVNGCTSSIYKLHTTDKKFIKNNFNIENLKNIFEQGNKYGYLQSFDSGNHFISLCIDKENNFYLVLHASAKEFKYTRLGLYPHENSWFKDDIKIFYNKDKSRYIRYIKGDIAKEFIRIAKQLPKFNEDVHDWYSKKISQSLRCKLEKVSLKHHYYMPTTYSVSMGTFLEKPNEIVPIFSKPGNDIYLFQTTNNPSWSLSIAGEKKCLIPHGWGQEIEDGVKISFKEDNILNINKIDHKIISGMSVNTKKIKKRIREFDETSNFSFFEKGKKYFQGKIIKTLHQVSVYQNGKIINYK